MYICIRLRKNEPKERKKKMINYNQELSDYCGGVCDTLVPFYDVPISCGLPRESGDIPPEMINVPGGLFASTQTYVVKASGDSMEGVGIYDGDLLMVEKLSQVHNKDVVYVSIDGEELIKTYYMDDMGRHWLVPANKKYKPILLSEEMNLYFHGRVIHNLRTPCDTQRNIYDSIRQYLDETKKLAPEPTRVPTQEEVEEAIKWVEPYVEGARHWLGPCRVLMDCGFIPKDDYETFCHLVNYVLPNLKTKPTKGELSRMATFCFSKPFGTWTDKGAPVHGEHYLKYHRAGEAMLKKLP